MENASKALLMAAGMLIAVLLVSIFALMFSTMSEYTKAYDERKETEELQAFNVQFEKYVQNGATAQDIVTVINLVKSYNEKNEYSSGDSSYMTAELTLVMTPAIDQETDYDSLNEFLKNNSYDVYNNGTPLDTSDDKTKMKKYNVVPTYENGKVKSIEFKDEGQFFD